jgi:hypothetical protein
MRNGKPITKADEIFSRPLRAQTMQGPRVTIASSEQVNTPCQVKFIVEVLPGGTEEGINGDVLKKWFSYSEYQGFGQFRNGSYGRADVIVKQLADGPQWGLPSIKK